MKMHTIHKSFTSLVVGCLVMFMVGCRPGVPSEYIQPSELEDMLYDWHLADAMAGTSGNDSLNIIKYHAAVLEKYGYTQAQFDSSLVYYMRHTERLKTIYEHLAKRFNDEASALGGAGGDAFANVGLKGDTANVWHGQTSMVLAPQKPFNLYSFSLKTDSSFHQGDQLMLDFNSDFIYQDGMRDGVAMLSVTFNNDSIASQTIHISSAGHNTLTIYDDNRLGIKAVNGFFLLNRSQSPGENTTTLKLMIISAVKLFRMHTNKEKPTEKMKTDSLARDSNHQSQTPSPPADAMIPERQPSTR